MTKHTETIEVITVSAAWRNAWDRVIPFLAFSPAVRKVIYTTNSIENINSQLRKIIKTRGHFPTDEAAAKLITEFLTPPCRVDRICSEI